VVASFEFLEWQDLYLTEKPYEIFIELPEDMDVERRTNLKFKRQENIPIEDIRGNETKFNLDTHAFQVVRSPTTFTAFNDRHAVDTAYAAECEKLLRDHVPGVNRVYFFNWRVSLLVKYGLRLPGSNRLTRDI
jgi:hypothetical protein